MANGLLTQLSSDYTWGSRPFTFDTWVKVPALSGNQCLLCSDHFDIVTGGFTVYITDDGTLAYYTAQEFGNHPIEVASPAGAIVPGEWMFISVTENVLDDESAAQLILHVNGVMVGLHEGVFNSGYTAMVSIGNYQNVQPFTGWFQDYRVEIGVARYTTDNYSVPTSRAPDAGSP